MSLIWSVYNLMIYGFIAFIKSSSYGICTVPWNFTSKTSANNTKAFIASARWGGGRLYKLVTFCRTPPQPLSPLILWCRGGLSYKPGGFLRSPRLTTCCNMFKICYTLRQINGDDDDDEGNGTGGGSIMSICIKKEHYIILFHSIQHPHNPTESFFEGLNTPIPICSGNFLSSFKSFDIWDPSTIVFTKGLPWCGYE